MAWSLEQRRQWLFPPVSGTVNGIDLSYLDPSDENDRSMLIEAEHPEYGGKLLEEIIVNGEPMSPRMHLTIHEIVANQIWDGSLPESSQTAERLTQLGYDRREADIAG